MILVYTHDLRLHALRICFVPLLDLGELGLQATHLHARPHGFLIQWPEKQPDDHSEDHKHPTVTQIQRRAHPKQDPHDDGGKWLHYPLEEAAVRVRVLEVPSKRE